MPSPVRCLFAFAAIVFVALPLAAQETPKKISYYTDVRPILVQHCQGCHQPARPGGKYVVTSYASLLKAGESESPGIVPGKPDESMLLAQIEPQDGQKPDMPKDADPLSADELGKIKQWIAEGAHDDTPMSDKFVFDMDHPPSYLLPPVLTSANYSPDGALIAVSGYHEVLLHKADGTGIVARLVGISERVESAVFSPDGKFLAVTGGSPARFGEIQIWDVAEKKLVLSVNSGFDTLYGASWSHDGKLLAFGCSDNTVRAIETATGKQVLQQGAHTDWVLDTAFSTDSSHLVSVSRDRSLKLTEVATQRFVDNVTSITPGALKGGLNTVDRHPSKDEVVVGGADGTPKTFRIYRDPSKPRQIGDDFNLIRTFEAMPGRVTSTTYSRDGSLIVAASSFDDPKLGGRLGELRVYQEADGKVLWKIGAPLQAMYSASFSPDGTQVAAVGFDGMLRILDAKTGQLIKEVSAVPIADPATVGGE